MPQLGQHGQVVPGNPRLCDLATDEPMDSGKIEFKGPSRRREGPHLTLLSTAIDSPHRHQILLSKKMDRLHRLIGHRPSISGEKRFELFQVGVLDFWSSLTVSHVIVGEKSVQTIVVARHDRFQSKPHGFLFRLSWEQGSQRQPATTTIDMTTTRLHAIFRPMVYLPGF